MLQLYIFSSNSKTHVNAKTRAMTVSIPVSTNDLKIIIITLKLNGPPVKQPICIQFSPTRMKTPT